MAASGASARQPRRGPAPIASFDHDGSDESSPETKQTFRLPEIREDPAGATQPMKSTPNGGGACLLPPEQRARSHSTPNASLHTPAAPRIDISRASSSSHQDSRDSSPELALFAGTGGNGEESRTRLELGFREDGALDLRSSTEELAFLEEAPGEPRPPPPPAPTSRRHSRKDSQSSEAALLAVSGRTSRLSSVGSQCSAHSALSGFSHASRISRLSVVSGVSRSPSPHRMLLETSFCGPKPIETDPEVCSAAVEEHLLEIAKKTSPQPQPQPKSHPPPTPGDARDRREVRTEVTVESVPSAPVLAAARAPSAPPIISTATSVIVNGDKHLKETRNRARAEERRSKPKVKREPSEPEVYKSANRTKDIIRIKLKPDEDYEDDDGTEHSAVTEVERSPARKPITLELEAAGVQAARPSQPPTSPGPSLVRPRDSRTPSPTGPQVSRKSSFCSLFKSRETIASPDSPSEALRRKRSLTEGRSRSKSRDRSATPTSASKMRGSVLSLFRTPKRGPASPSPSSREGSPVVHAQRPLATPISMESTRRGEKLKYYEDTRDGIIHIPLRTPPDEQPTSCEARRDSGPRVAVAEVITHREPPRPASAPTTRAATEPARTSAECATGVAKPVTRTVLPDGSIIIPLRSPTDKSPETTFCDSNHVQSGVKVNHAVENDVSLDSTNCGGPPEGRDAADGAEASPDREPRNLGVASSTVTDTPNGGEDGRMRRKERLLFSTHVGSREQVFSTQFSITKTPSVTSEMSGSFPSFIESEERILRPRDLSAVLVDDLQSEMDETGEAASGVPSPQEPPRDSSESEPSSETAPTRAGNDVEKRGLVVQESFEEELPYVPTTLPLERSVALPMVPVRERGGVRVAGVERPRALPGGASGARMPRPPPASAVAPASSPDKLRIRLPRRARPSSATAPSSRTARSRTRSGGDGAEARPKPEWIDFEEVPEQRKQPKRIQTLPAGAAPAPAVLFSYVEPERCRCECHVLSRTDETLGSMRLSSSPSAGEQVDAESAPLAHTPHLFAEFDSRPLALSRVATESPGGARP